MVSQHVAEVEGKPNLRIDRNRKNDSNYIFKADYAAPLESITQPDTEVTITPSIRQKRVRYIDR